MKSFTTDKFWKLYLALPSEIQNQANFAYAQFIEEPYHPSLQFKRVHSMKPIYSARVNINYRAIGILNDGDMIWFWIGSHREYEKILQKILFLQKPN
jgi:hypothetical protein